MLPVGGGKGSNKRIAYTNPYPVAKVTNFPFYIPIEVTSLQIEHFRGFFVMSINRKGIAFMNVDFCTKEKDLRLI